ncbi:hypothetical protein Ctob_016042, partial [Chrysochromulina tobinii]
LRYAIGSSVYVKRSNGEETVAFVKEYDAEKALYTVELERLGSRKAKTCSDKDLRAVDMVEGLLYSARAAVFFPFQAAQEPEPAEEAAQAEAAQAEAVKVAAEEAAQAAEVARAATEEEEAQAPEAARVQCIHRKKPRAFAFPSRCGSLRSGDEQLSKEQIAESEEPLFVKEGNGTITTPAMSPLSEELTSLPGAGRPLSFTSASPPPPGPHRVWVVTSLARRPAAVRLGSAPRLARIIFLAMMVGFTGAHTTILMRDDFSTDGNLVGSTPDVGGVWAFQTNGLDYTGQGSGPVTVSQGALTVSSALAEDFYSNFTAVVSTGSVYAGMDINHATPSSLDILHISAFTHFNVFNSSISICLVRPTGHNSTGYKLRLGQSYTTEMAYGTTYRLVNSFNTTTGRCTLWVNPSSEASTRIMTANPVAPDTTISAVAFRQTNSTPPWTLSIRNLIVATTFAEACPP